VQATTAGVALALGGLLADGVGALARRGALGASLAGQDTGYLAVYGLEIVLLVATIVLMSALARGPRTRVAA
jgi:BCD family chlorophyll transporter-like MFS transporter